jgi:hypothetical protein
MAAGEEEEKLIFSCCKGRRRRAAARIQEGTRWMDEHGKDEWVARWQIGSKPRMVAEKLASRSYCRLKLPEIKPAKNRKSTELIKQK